MKSSEQIAKEINDRIVEYNRCIDSMSHLNQDAVHELESAIHELSHLLEWIKQ